MGRGGEKLRVKRADYAIDKSRAFATAALLQKEVVGGGGELLPHARLRKIMDNILYGLHCGGRYWVHLLLYD